MLKHAHPVERKAPHTVEFANDVDIKAIQDQLLGPLASSLAARIRRGLEAGELVIVEGEVVWAD